MSVCCRCNAQGCCENCSCKKSLLRYVECLPLCKSQCENESIKFPSCDGKKPNIFLLNCQGEVNSSYTLFALTESSLKEIDSEVGNACFFSQVLQMTSYQNHLYISWIILNDSSLNLLRVL